MVNVEIVYVASDQTLTHLHCTLPNGTTVNDALLQSGIYNICPETQGLPVGIFSKRVEGTTPLKSGDRIEIYRPLSNDPKEKRRARAKKDS